MAYEAICIPFVSHSYPIYPISKPPRWSDPTGFFTASALGGQGDRLGASGLPGEVETGCLCGARPGDNPEKKDVEDLATL